MTVVQLPDTHPAAVTTPIADSPVLAVAEPRYVGLVTRGIAFALDAAVINVVAIVVGLGASLILSLFHLPKELKTILVAVGGVVYVLWSNGYFVFFWSTTGQTPGDRAMQFKVVTANGDRIRPGRAVVRVIGLLLAALPLLAGYLLIPFDARRRGLQDLLARTVVIEAPPPEPDFSSYGPATATRSAPPPGRP